MQALEYIEKNAKKFGLTRAKFLPVSGAFHTPLMKGAVEPLKEALSQCTYLSPEGADGDAKRGHRGAKITAGRLLEVVANIDARPYPVGNRRALMAKLSDQVWQPVRWEQCVQRLYSRDASIHVQGFPHTFELGPGRQLGTMLKSINAKAFARYKNIEV